MTDFFTFMLELVKQTDGATEVRWAELIVITFGIMFSLGFGGLLAFVVSWHQFRRRAFFDQMVIGVNVLEPNNGRWLLTLRTLREDNLGAILDNPVLERLVEKAARRCTEARPVLILKNKEDHALLLTKIQNVISGFFAREYMMMMVGFPSHRVWVDFAVTCERYGGLKATKIRVIVFYGVDIYRFLIPNFGDVVDVEQNSHRDRIKTLKVIARLQHVGPSLLAYGSVEIPLGVGT